MPLLSNAFEIFSLDWDFSISVPSNLGVYTIDSFLQGVEIVFNFMYETFHSAVNKNDFWRQQQQMKLISSIFCSLESDAWWNMDIKFHFHFRLLFSKRERNKNRWLCVEFRDFLRCRSISLFAFSSGSAEGSPKIKQGINIFFGELANIFNEISFQAFTLRSPSWPHSNSSSWHFYFIPFYAFEHQTTSWEVWTPIFINSSFITLCWNYYVYS